MDLITPEFDRVASDKVWKEPEALRATNKQLVGALEHIAEGMTHVRAPHRMSAASALAKNTLARLPK